ncbi:MAG: hypothetical protein H8E32_15360 [Nitrospinae bacterium]|nr:hypothetical protein [Nitrospinota bacterium]
MVRILISILLISFWTASSAAGQTKLEIIPLKNRLVEEVIPTVRSILGKNGTVTGMHGQLIIRAHPNVLREVKQVLSELDSALKNLRITVKQGSRLRLEEKERSVNAEIPIGKEGSVIIGDPDFDGLILEDGRINGKIRARLLDKNSQEDDMETQVVVTLEGRPALIHVTQSFPVKEIRNLRSGNVLTQVESIQFKDVRTGLMVLPRLRGEQVILEVSPQKSRLNGQNFETFGINTVVRGQIGEWVELGGVAQNRQGSNAALNGRTTTHKETSRRVFLKVDFQ